MPASSMEDLVSLCTRRGFIFQSSEIYGGLRGMYDYGPMGVELKNNLKQAWWSAMVYARDDVEGLDASILTHPQVLRQSGHEATFSDPLVDCKQCKKRSRADHIKDGKCPFCGSTQLTEPRPFNLMFRTRVGPIEDDTSDASFAYLRPETAQSIFTNFKNILDTRSKKLPFGIAQIGKAFRNEITPRNFIFRVREFEQMELEFFVEPGTDEDWHAKWVEDRLDWWELQGVNRNAMERYVVPPEELAHYSKATTDIMYRFPHGVEELEGVANRTDFDLGSHTKQQKDLNLHANVMVNSGSNAKLAMQLLPDNRWVVPFVIEPSAGVDRGVLAILNEAYEVENLADGKTRTVLHLKPHLAPIKTAVLPLKQNHAEIMARATSIRQSLQHLQFGRVLLETSGNVGKSYRKHDEIGTPYCVTADFQTLEDDTVTVRERDSMAQERVAVPDLGQHLQSKLNQTD